MSASTRKQVLILGGGFSGLYTALGLEKTLARDSDVQITLEGSNPRPRGPSSPNEATYSDKLSAKETKQRNQRS